MIGLSKKYIWVTFSKEGIHCYPEAGTREDLKEVSYLQYQHRHIFHFKVFLEVDHDNRDVEFILFKKWLESLYNNTLVLNHKSCEMIAEDLYNLIVIEYPYRSIKIEVSEDNENGCSIEWI